jgi:hypothetical protein
MYYDIYIVDPARGGAYKRVVEPPLFLSQLTDFKEVSAPVKRQKGQKAGHTIHCE